MIQTKKTERITVKKEIEDLKTVREELQKQKDHYNAEYAKFVEQHNELTAKIAVCKGKEFDLVTDIKLEAIEEYEKTGNKKLECGVGIRLITKLNYDSDKALLWALKHEMALSLDKKRFEQLAKQKPMIWTL